MTESSTAPGVTYVASVPFVGGAELTQLQVLGALRELGVEVHALVPGRGPLQTRLQALGIASQNIGEPRSARLASRYSRNPLRQASAASLFLPGRSALASLRSARESIVYCGGFRAQMRVTWAARALRSRVVWHVHEIFDGASAVALASVGRAAHRVITVSEAAASQPGIRRLRNRVVPVRNGVPDSFFRDAGPRPKSGRVAFVGHLTPMKDHAGFIRVVEDLRARDLVQAATIVGEAPYLTASHARYAHRIRSTARAADVSVVSASPEEMPELLRTFDLVLQLGSRPEGFGRAIAEAQALGVPVVTYAWGGAREIVRHDETGLLVKPGDVAAATDAAARLLHDEPLRQRMAKAAHDHASRTLRASPSAQRVASEMLAPWS